MQFSFQAGGISYEQCREIRTQYCCRGPKWRAWLFKVTPMQVLGITLSPTPASSKHAALYKLGWTKTLFRVENKVYRPSIRGWVFGWAWSPFCQASLRQLYFRGEVRSGAMRLYAWRGLPTLLPLVHPFPLLCLTPAKWQEFSGLWPFPPPFQPTHSFSLGLAAIGQVNRGH